MTFKTETAYIEVPAGEPLPLDYLPGQHLVYSDLVTKTSEGLEVDWDTTTRIPENYQVYLKWNPVAVAVWIDEKEEEPNDE